MNNSVKLLESGEKTFGVPIVMVTDRGRIDWESGSIILELPDGLEDLPI